MILELALVASVYSRHLEGRPMAGGGPYRHANLTLAHRSWPFGTMVRITRGKNSVEAPVTDRGPFVKGRDMDVSGGVAAKLGMDGVHRVRVTRLFPISRKK